MTPYKKMKVLCWGQDKHFANKYNKCLRNADNQFLDQSLSQIILSLNNKNVFLIFIYMYNNKLLILKAI